MSQLRPAYRSPSRGRFSPVSRFESRPVPVSFDGRSVQALKPLLVFEPQRQIGDEPEEKPKGPQRENPGVSLLAAFRHLAEALCRSEASGVYGLSIGNVKMDLGVG